MLTNCVHMQNKLICLKKLNITGTNSKQQSNTRQSTQQSLMVLGLGPKTGFSLERSKAVDADSRWNGIPQPYHSRKEELSFLLFEVLFSEEQVKESRLTTGKHEVPSDKAAQDIWPAICRTLSEWSKVSHNAPWDVGENDIWGIERTLYVRRRRSLLAI